MSEYVKTILSRDIASAILARYYTIKKFHEECIGKKLSYYQVKRMLTGYPYSPEKIDIVEKAAKGLIINENDRGRIPDNTENLKNGIRELIDSIENFILQPLSFENFKSLNNKMIHWKAIIEK